MKIVVREEKKPHEESLRENMHFHLPDQKKKKKKEKNSLVEFEEYN
jgi:hypothetical protein